jgi:hypothetical protein
MIYEFAISPGLCTNFQDLRFFLATFGGEQGRLFSDIPRKKWVRSARAAIKVSENGQVEKKRLVAGIERLTRKAIYCRNSAPELESEYWLDHAIAAHKDRPFQAILTDCYDGDEECVLRNDQEFTEDCRWKVPLDKTIKRDALNMIEAIRPMLDCSQELILVDRNFDPDKFRWRAFLIEIAAFLSKRNFSPSIKTINYHVGNKITPDHMQLLCNTHFSKKLPQGMKVNFIVWPWDELHDRYILTDVGGVDFGIGLDIYDGSGPQNVKVSRISAETRDRWWKACKKKETSFSIP